MTDNITIPRATVQQALEALEGFVRFAAIHSDGPDASDKYLAEDYAEEAFLKTAKVLPDLRKALGYPTQISAKDGDTVDDALVDLAASRLEQPEQAEAFNDGVLEGMLRERVHWLRQQEQTNPWRDAVDHELSTLHMVASDDPQESIRRLIDWHCAVQIDPLVSSAAQELIDRGKREALEQPEQEPVAVFDEQQGSPVLLASAPMLSDGQPLYTHPPRRETEQAENETLRQQHLAAHNNSAALMGALTQVSLLTDLGGEVAEYADVVDAVRRLHALNGELLDALKECLPYVRETLLNTGSMDAYHTETKASVAIKKAEGNT